MYELQSTLSTYARRKYSSGEISLEHLKNILKVRFFFSLTKVWNSFIKTYFLHWQEVRKYLKECIQIFSYEPTCIQEGRLAAIARLDLVELETYVDSVEKAE